VPQRLFDADITLAAYHLALDAHPEIGNNALLARELGQAMAAAFAAQQGRGGKIVSIASIMGLVGSVSSSAAYCASKAGVVNLTRVLAIEWAKHNIQVNSVAPTFVRTPLTEGIFANEAFLQSVLDRTPNGKLATPESIADAVVFLASPNADMITGITLPVDGGWTAW